jgi:ketosteroid isomerase-like protein
VSLHHSDIARRAYDAFARADLDGLIEHTHEDVEVRTVTGAVAHGEPYRGHEGLAEYLRDADRLWDEIELQPHEFVELDDKRVLVLGRVRTRRGTARTDLPSAWLWEFEGELVRRMSILTDAVTIQRLAVEREDGNPR